MMRRRVVYKTEKLSKYTERVKVNTERIARKLLIRGETLLQERIRYYTPVHTGRTRIGIVTEHKGRWESVRVGAGGDVGVDSFIQERSRGYGAGFGGRTINFIHPGYTVRARILEGSVYSDDPNILNVEYDTGIYNDEGGNKPIRPTNKKALAFTLKDGRKVIVAQVKGYKGKHMFAKGAAAMSTPTYYPNRSRDLMTEWRIAAQTVRPR